ncbi:MAG: hypothetical protein KDA89_16940, partial [Planctomycetaceae bacterium]|nr:hypothetical protein [Planctomycetaceae bacterium]
RGANVVCLSPRDGQMKMPQPDGTPSLVRCRFDVLSRLADFDKRFDSVHWLGADVSDIRGLGFTDGLGNGTVSFGRLHGWHWMEARFRSGGRIIICCVPLTALWRETPVPRHLLAYLVRAGETSRIPEKGN